MLISDELLLRLEELGKIRLTDEERENMKSDINLVIEYMDIINSLPADGTEPMSHPLSTENVLRDDSSSPSVDSDLLLGNSSSIDNGYFSVPRSLK